MKNRSIVALLLFASSPNALAAQSLVKQPGVWAQDYTHRAADPSVRFGKLPNGLSYAIMHNDTPKDGVSMRMRIGSGSLQERDDEQGLAHFLEHMAFRGSTNIADGEVVHMLERQGLQFGADTNAFTAQDETVYMFNFPKADPTALETGFKLFREIGERLNLAPAAISAEKGVVLSEERLRDTPQYRAVKANLSTTLDGTRLVSRWPIGTVATVSQADHDRLTRFYQANYRPENATIVIVGNVDPAAIEQRIIAGFASWKGKGAPDVISLGKPSAKKLTGEFVADGAPDQVSLNWVGPNDNRAETEAVDREDLVRLVALTVLNQRLSDQASKPGSPFLGAQASTNSSLMRSASLTQIGLAASPDKWQEALNAASAEQRQLLRDGVQTGELQRAVSTLRTQLQAKAARASTRKSADIADELVSAADNDKLFTSDTQDLALALPVLAKVTAADVNSTLKSLFGTGTPILFRSARSSGAGEVRLAAALITAYSRLLGAQVKEAAVTWPYTSFGDASKVVSQSEDKELGVTTVRFANGTRLIVKPTNYEKDKIDVAVSLGNGRTSVPPSLTRALWQAQLFPLAGTGKLSIGDIQKWTQTTGKVASVALDASTRAFILKGATRPADLLSQMQLLAAYARDPGFRAEAIEKGKSFAPMFSSQLETNAGAAYIRGAQALMVGGDQRFEMLPSSSDLKTVEASDLSQLLRKPLSGRADVVMVGDVSVADAIKVTESTFAAGPSRDAPADNAPRVSVAAINGPATFEHKGRADQAFYGEYFLLPDYYTNPKVAAVADVAASVLSARLVDTVREKLGFTYSPMVSALSSIDLRGEGYFNAAIETPEKNFAAFHTLLSEQLKDLATKPISADELSRAKQPLIETHRKAVETNPYWLGKLAEMTREPKARDELVARLANIQAVGASDVQALATQYLNGHRPIIALSKAAAAQPGTSAPLGATNR
jgi:zinc protease